MPLLTECMKILFPELIEQSKKLAKKIPKNKYNYVFGIPAGGLVTSYIVANEIKAIMLTVDQFKNEFFHNPKVLIVDDLIDGGGTIQKFNPHKEHDVAVVYRKKHSPKNLTKYVVKEMPNEWLDFPHEKEATGIEEHYARIIENKNLKASKNRVLELKKLIDKYYDKNRRNKNYSSNKGGICGLSLLE